MLNEQGDDAPTGGTGGSASRSPGEGVIHVTQEEKEAIDRVSTPDCGMEATCNKIYLSSKTNFILNMVFNSIFSHLSVYIRLLWLSCVYFNFLLKNIQL